jgi:hypothetical protein
VPEKENLNLTPDPVSDQASQHPGWHPEGTLEGTSTLPTFTVLGTGSTSSDHH